MVEKEHRPSKTEGLQVRPDPLDYQLDLFDLELNRLKGLKFQRDKIKSYHYGKSKKKEIGASSRL